MSSEQTPDGVAARCDSPDCNSWTYTPRALSWLFVLWSDGDADPFADVTLDFCSWDCAMRYGSTIEPNVTVEIGDE